MLHCKAPFIGLCLTPDKKFCCCCCNEDYENNIEKHRIDMYNNKINNLCKTCSTRYEFDAPEYDYIFNHNIRNFNIKTGEIHNFKIGWLHIVYSYMCNADCVMCGLDKHDTRKLNINDIPKQEIIKISLQGGEIFVFEKEILELLNAIQPKYLNVITNGTIISRKIYDKLYSFNNQCITFSIDGVGLTNQAIRKNCNYDKIINNIKKIHDKYPKLSIVINYTVTMFNIYNILDDLIQIKVDLKNIKFQLCINLCYQPEYFSIAYLDEYNKTEIRNFIDVKTMIKNKKIENLRKFQHVIGIYKNPNMFKELNKLLNNNIIKNKREQKLMKKVYKQRPELFNNIHKNIQNFIVNCPMLSE